MPQMAPMNWMILFMTFVMIFIITVNKIYYISMNNINNNNKYENLHSPKMNLWKW